jgi:hypothetical protein
MAPTTSRCLKALGRPDDRLDLRTTACLKWLRFRADTQLGRVTPPQREALRVEPERQRYRLRRRRDTNAKPNRPDPIRKKLAGSGTAAKATSSNRT